VENSPSTNDVSADRTPYPNVPGFEYSLTHTRRKKVAENRSRAPCRTNLVNGSEVWKRKGTTSRVYLVCDEEDLHEEPFSMYFVHVDEVTHLPGFIGPNFRSRGKLTLGVEENVAMDIPEDPLERKKWMLRLWREDYEARFSVFRPADQPAREICSWTPDMWEPYDPKPDVQGDFGPRVIRHIRWFADTKQFLAARYQIVLGPDLYFDCKTMHCRLLRKKSGFPSCRVEQDSKGCDRASQRHSPWICLHL
jgi:hypothetical protein